MGGFKYQIVHAFENKHYSQPKLVKTVYVGGVKSRKLKTQKQSEISVVKNIRNLLKPKEENIVIADVIIRNTKTIF